MSEVVIQVEELDGGLSAAFINLPHFRTSSARLTVNSGSLHEAAETAGAAHFLEHLTFQGTTKFPTEQSIHEFTEEHGMNRNAYTSQVHTSFVANGYDLESVGTLVAEVALSPLLEHQALERERKPILDEEAGYASSPYYTLGINHDRVKRGDRHARPVIGTRQDIQNMTHEHLTDYYSRNYRLGNAALVISSSESIERQREFAGELFDNTVLKSGDQSDASTPVDVPDFNPEGLLASLQQVDLPLSAQTNVSIQYGLPEVQDVDDLMLLYTIGATLSNLAHRRLRSELALCYGAHAGMYKTANMNFRANQNWSNLYAGANLNGQDATYALDALLDDVINKELPETTIESTLQSLRRSTADMLQDSPAAIADFVRNSLTFSPRERINLEETKDFADRVTLDAIRARHKSIISTQPLVIATSPDPKVLERVGNWATGRISS